MRVSKPAFFERLHPSIGTVMALLLSGPMVLLAALPFSSELAIVLAVTVPLGLIALVVLSAPTLSIQSGELRVGRMRIPLAALGEAKSLGGEAARFERGPGLSPGSQRLFRGDIRDVVRIEIVDPSDPTEYVLFSSRRGRELVSALDANRT